MHTLIRLSLVVMVVAVGACGKSSPTSPSSSAKAAPNTNPSITSISVTSFGVSELGTFQGSASASDPDGDSLTFTWSIGGIAATGSSWSKTLSGNGTYTATVTVSDGKGGTAMDSRSFVVGNMTGTWQGITGPSELGTYRFALTQTLGVITGTYWDSTFGDGKLDPGEPGKIESNGNVTMRVKQGPFSDWYFNGVMDSTGRRVAGTVRGSGFTGQPFTIAK